MGPTFPLRSICCAAVVIFDVSDCKCHKMLFTSTESRLVFPQQRILPSQMRPGDFVQIVNAVGELAVIAATAQYVGRHGADYLHFAYDGEYGEQLQLQPISTDTAASIAAPYVVGPNTVILTCCLTGENPKSAKLPDTVYIMRNLSAILRKMINVYRRSEQRSKERTHARIALLREELLIKAMHPSRFAYIEGEEYAEVVAQVAAEHK